MADPGSDQRRMRSSFYDKVGLSERPVKVEASPVSSSDSSKLSEKPKASSSEKPKLSDKMDKSKPSSSSEKLRLTLLDKFKPAPLEKPKPPVQETYFFPQSSGKLKLQELLSLTPLPVERLLEFCCTFKVPDQYRHLVWKLVLGLIPNDARSCEYVQKQRAAMFRDAWKALLSLRISSVEWQTWDEFNDSSRSLGGFTRYKSKFEKLNDLSKMFENDEVVQWSNNGCSFVSRPESCGPNGKHTLRMKLSLEPKSKQKPQPIKHKVPNILSPEIHRSTPVSSPAILASPVFEDFSSPNLQHSRSEREDSVSSLSTETTNLQLSDGRLSILSLTSDLSNTVYNNTHPVISPIDLVFPKSLFSDLVPFVMPDDIQLDAKIFGVYTLKNHYIGFISSGNSPNADWDLESTESNEYVPSVMDTLLAWMINRGTIAMGSYFSQIVHRVDYAAYLAIGKHLSCDSIEETYTIRLAIWDLVSRNQDALVDAVLVSGRKMLTTHSAASLHLKLDSVRFFSSPYLPFLAISLFANLLSSISVEKVLDKIISRNFHYLGYLFVDLLLQAKTNLLMAESCHEAVRVLTNLNILETDCAVNSSLDLWHKHSTTLPSE